MEICQIIEELIHYARKNLYLNLEDIPYIKNQLYYLLNIKEPITPYINEKFVNSLEEPTPILDRINLYAVKNNLVNPNNLQQFDAQMMDIVTPRPSEVINHFKSINNNEKACHYLYDLSIKSYYIRKREVNKNIIWEFPNMIITINLSKPEILNQCRNNKITINKDTTHYPKCPLCIENVGFHGSTKKESRQTLRMIPINLNNETWCLQYSPYVYYNEHCIIFNKEHKPMKINSDTFRRLFDFVDSFPNYFIGSNAGLPRIGGSILTHDHYQGGRYTFPLQKAKTRQAYDHKQYPNVKIYTVDWYNSVIRLISDDRENLINLATEINNKWKDFNDESLNIISKTNEQHNGLTPILHKEDDHYILNIILRNNRTSIEHPDGIFHAHKKYHHIKKEGIGLIEAMGMFILPGRLKDEIEKKKDFKDSIYQVCINILKNTSVFKDDIKGIKGLNSFLENCKISNI